MKPWTLAVDVDEVCADLLGTWLSFYNIDHKTRLLAEDITSWDITPFLNPGTKDRFYAYLQMSSLYQQVLPIPYARRAVNQLRADGHRVLFVTSCFPGTIEAKRDWLVRWGFLPKDSSVDFLPVQDKALIRADYLFDDRPENVAEFARYGGRGVLVRREHNLAMNWPEAYTISSLKDAPAWLRGEDI